jgi:transcription termination/antitermination protein NusG
MELNRPLNARSSELSWYALRTRARHEKVVRGRLERNRILALLPTAILTRQWNDRPAQVEMPLFPGYCFARFALRDRFTVLNIPGVVQVVGGTVPEPVAEQDIEAVMTLLQSRLHLEPYPYLAEGMRVRVKQGPLRGMVGIVLQQRTACRLVVGIQLIYQAVSVHLYMTDVEALPPAHRPNSTDS